MLNVEEMVKEEKTWSVPVSETSKDNQGLDAEIASEMMGELEALLTVDFSKSR